MHYPPLYYLTYDQPARTARAPHHRAWKAALLAVALAAVSVPAWSDEGLPPVRDSGSGASYVSGGISEDQSRAFKAARAQWPLAISLVQKAGHTNEYTASAQVKIVDAAGRTLLDAASEGPFMLVKLAPGSYAVSASLNGQALKPQRVQIVQGRPARLDFVFPAGAG